MSGDEINQELSRLADEIRKLRKALSGRSYFTYELARIAEKLLALMESP